MGKTKGNDDTTAGDGRDGRGSRAKLVVGAAALVAIGVLAGGKVLGGSATPASATESTTTTTEPDGPVTTVESITVNLADGRFLKLGLAFEVHHDVEYPHASGHGEADELTKGFAREIDASIMLLSRFTYEQLVAPDGKVAAKAALLEELRHVSHDAISDVFFHEFVMQ